MNEPKLSLENIIRMALLEGGRLPVVQARRLLRLAHEIGADIEYDAFSLTLAAYLHDWGTFPRFAQKGVDHALRSRQVAEVEILPYVDLPFSMKRVVLEAIELHDYRDLRPPQSNEALLLREANMLEFLGEINTTYEFIHGAMDIDVCYHRILYRRAGIQRRFTLPRAREIAQVRLAHMDQRLRWLEEENYVPCKKDKATW